LAPASAWSGTGLQRITAIGWPLRAPMLSPAVAAPPLPGRRQVLMAVAKVLIQPAQTR
jgi:hypothetical protein